MTDGDPVDVLLALCRNPLPRAGDADPLDARLREVMRAVESDRLHVMHCPRNETNGFHWQLALDFHLQGSHSDSTLDGRALWLESQLKQVFAQDLGELTVVGMRQTGFGEAQSGVDCIISTYSWAPDVSPSERAQAMWEHFAMERDVPDYSAVRFNVGQDGPREIDFVFQAYVNDPQGLSRIYDSPRLAMMRQHSEGFLDTSTRKLTFGTVDIVHVGP